MLVVFAEDKSCKNLEKLFPRLLLKSLNLTLSLFYRAQRVRDAPSSSLRRLKKSVSVGSLVLDFAPP